MNLDELRSVQSKERQKDSLQNLRPSFYQEVGEYIADLEDERDRVAEQAEDPFSSPEVGRLTDEIETAKDVVEAIYERRMGKLVKQASLAAAGMPADDEGLTAEEADLFDDLVDRIESNKSRVLDVLEGVETGQPEAGASAGASDGPAADPASGSEPGTAPERSVGADPASRSAEDGDAPPVPPQEPPDAAGEPTGADSGAASSDPTDSSGVSPADVMGGEPSSIDAGDAESGPTPRDESDASPSPTGSLAEPSDPTAAAEREPNADMSDAARAPDSADATADGGAAADAGGSTADDVDRTTVRITRDVGSILGIDDREYALSSDDIVTLPEQNAEPLVERDAAERLE
ncbi:DNA replication complex subunit Gins51 [Halopiger thermotolerans]